MMHRKSATGRTAWGLLAGILAVLLLASGCDTLDTGSTPITLPPKEVTFRFELSADDLAAGQTATIPSLTTQDITELLRQDGFTKAEIISAGVRQATLRRVQPLNVDLGFLQEVALQVTAEGLPAVTVAAATNPSGNRVELTADADQEIGAYLARPAFGTALRLTPEQVPDEQFVFEVTLTLRVQVEGV